MYGMATAQQLTGQHHHRVRSCQAPDIVCHGDVIKERWQVLEKLGAGTFGQVYKVLDLKTGQNWAMKTESKSARKPVLRMDVAIVKALNGKTHFAAFFACGHEEKFSFLIIQLLGRNLATRKRMSHDSRFPLRTVVRIGLQTMTAIRELHTAGFLHRDLKPSNLATGLGEHEKQIYLLDFGLARKYLDDKGRIFLPRPKCNFRGTVRYASPRAHTQQELSRGDDIWSLMYSLLDLRLGHLPWHNIRDMKRVGEAKIITSTDQLCRGVPASWKRICEYCNELAYETVPDYNFIMRMLNDSSSSKPNGIIDVNELLTAEWEWELPPNEKSSNDDFGPTAW